MTQPKRQAVKIPAAFPKYGYTPYGYLDNPAHCAVLNRSGAVRSVPPLGFGFWCRRFPWPYGEGTLRRVNYLSFIDLGLTINGQTLHAPGDFAEKGVEIGSSYHTKTMLSYDLVVERVAFSARYFLASPDSLACLIEIKNEGESEALVTVHATHIYGFHEARWWGSDGVASNYQPQSGTMINTIYAYGDTFVFGANRFPEAHNATASSDEWRAWVQAGDLSSRDATTMEFPGAMYALLNYPFKLAAGQSITLSLGLTRGVNQKWALAAHHKTMINLPARLNRKLKADEKFYRSAPLLNGDFPKAWKEGWIYDLETIRMTIREPVGIYKHHWDGMQIYTPRAVLGEAMLDALCLSYSDMELAKDVVLGTFADAPMPNVPCSREDGSMNMIGAGGAECGTAPIWGMPFLAIQSIYERSRDKSWLEELYPYLTGFLDWWLENRTDAEGWFHCNNSWESGQDGSKRFTFDGGNEASVSDFVRTVDVEAAMAHAMSTLAYFARQLGKEAEAPRWEQMAEKRIAKTRSMYRDGWFRDFDGRTGQPIILKEYYDVMMMMPLAVGITTPEQVEGMMPMFGHFQRNPQGWLEWPSFMEIFTEAAWNAHMSGLAAEVLADIGNLIYARTTQRSLKPVGKRDVGLPLEYNFRIPGSASEFWPKTLDEDIQNGAENYGWGATFPTLVIRNLFGFREDPGGFTIAPVIPANLIPGDGPVGKQFGIENLRYQTLRIDLNCRLDKNGDIETHLELHLDAPAEVIVQDEQDQSLLTLPAAVKMEGVLAGPNGKRYRVIVHPLA